MAKLTLHVDAEIIEQAKRLAGERGTSVSALFDGFISHILRAFPRQALWQNVLFRIVHVFRGLGVDQGLLIIDR